MTNTAEFKRCPACDYGWISREKFIEDPALEVIGYQVNFNHLEEGFFLFTHHCRTTLAISAGYFKDLYDEPIFSERLIGSEECTQYCLNKNERRPCPAKCECAYVREIIQIIHHWPKKNK